MTVTTNKTTIDRICRRCKKPCGVLRKQIIKNGTIQILFFCLDCHQPCTSGIYIKHENVKQWLEQGRIKNRQGIICQSIDDIPTLKDMRANKPCVVCGELGVEYHHWLPRAFENIIENYDDWPKNHLCRTCHRLWHNTVTPYLNGKNWKDKYNGISKVKI